MRSKMRLAVFNRPSVYGSHQLPPRSDLATVVMVQVKPGWREWIAAIIILSPLLLMFLWGFARGIDITVDMFDQRIDNICNSLPWPRPAACALKGAE